MHTSEYDHNDKYTGESHWTFHHNGDYSGDVHLIMDGERIEFNKAVMFPTSYEDVRGLKATIDIPFEVLRNFVLNAMREDMISGLENASYQELWDMMTYAKDE